MSTSPSAHRTLLASVVLAGALLMSACGDDGTASPAGSSAASIGRFAVRPGGRRDDLDLGRRDVPVACDQIEVTPLVPLGADAHEYEPTVQDADRLRSAGLVVANGLGLEEGALDLIDSAGTDGATVLELGPQLDPLESGAEGEHGHGDEGHEREDHARRGGSARLDGPGSGGARGAD